MSALSYIYLDSHDRIKNRSTSGDTSRADFSISFGSNNVNQIALSSYDVGYAIENINSNNNIAFIETATQTFSVTLTNNRYDYVKLKDEVQTQLTALGIGAFSVTFTDSLYAILAPEPFRFITNPINGGTTKDWADMMGMTKNQELSINAVGGIADIAYTNKLYIVCDEAHAYKTRTDQGTNRRLNNVLGVVYLNPDAQYGNDKLITSPAEVVDPHRATRQIENLKWVDFKSDGDLSRLSIEFLDDNGEKLPDNQRNKINWGLELITR